MKHVTPAILYSIFLIALITASVQAEPPMAGSGTQEAFDLQGHRGARGLYPENTIPAFLYALDLGVTTLEMDVVINADGNVYLSHEPWMSAIICSHPDGSKVKGNEEKSLKIYTMSDAQVSGFDCGSRGHSGFKQQQSMPVSKPMLSAVFEAVRQRSAETGREPVLFNIEIKSAPEGDNVFHPPVAQYVRALYDVVKQNNTVSRTSIQSFDPRALEATRAIDPNISTVLLVDNYKGLQDNLKRLNFTPDIYSPNYKRLNKKSVRAAHAQNIRVIPWTINKEKTMREQIAWGIDGLITDYPELALKVLTEIQQTQ